MKLKKLDIYQAWMYKRDLEFLQRARHVCHHYGASIKISTNFRCTYVYQRRIFMHIRLFYSYYFPLIRKVLRVPPLHDR